MATLPEFKMHAALAPLILPLTPIPHVPGRQQMWAGHLAAGIQHQMSPTMALAESAQEITLTGKQRGCSLRVRYKRQCQIIAGAKHWQTQSITPKKPLASIQTILTTILTCLRGHVKIT
jgi:hypothetical protein